VLEILLQSTRDYLENKLLPFWTERIVDPEHGGFQTNYDRNGRRTDVADKTLLCQARVLFTLSHALRLGYEWNGADAMLQQGIDFLERAFRDRQFDGYTWIVDRQGNTLDDRKVIYGHAFLIYGFAEYALLSGDQYARQRACDIFELVMSRATDLRHGGFFEHFDRRFALEAVRPDGIHHKSLDVHMHLMEAFTALYELTGASHHRQALEEIMDLIFDRMVDTETGTGIAMFRPDWTPVANVQLNTLWGSDRFDPTGKPPHITSYGHNIELAWLYLHGLDILGVDRKTALPRVAPIFDHTRNHGVDWECGGLYVEGDRAGEATEKTKEFWQQAEALVGFLDAADLTGDDSYLDAFRNIHTFVFTHMINWEQGEWFPLLARDGTVLWDYMGHNWKICYHTIRGMVEVVKRLERA
jgi:mannobiose 2-epimerase